MGLDRDTPLARYDEMIKIWIAPGHRIRMAELADQVAAGTLALDHPDPR